MGAQVFRIDPKGPVEAYTTYQVVSPKSTHYRRATCEEVECEQWLKGWVTRVPIGSALAQYVASKAHGRKFTETTKIGESEREFIFPPGQECFRSAKHQIPVGRDPLYVVRHGDWRGNPSGERRQHVRAADWVEDFALHQQGLADRLTKG